MDATEKEVQWAVPNFFEPLSTDNPGGAYFDGYLWWRFNPNDASAVAAVHVQTPYFMTPDCTGDLYAVGERARGAAVSAPVYYQGEATQKFFEFDAVVDGAAACSSRHSYGCAPRTCTSKMTRLQELPVVAPTIPNQAPFRLVMMGVYQ
jgi:hypothetical protein